METSQFLQRVWRLLVSRALRSA